MSIRIIIETETVEQARAQMAELLGSTSLTTAAPVTQQPAPVVEAQKRTKKDRAAAETPPVVMPTPEPTPAPAPVAANPFADEPAKTMSFDDFKKRCNALIEVIPGNERFDKASELLQKHAGVLMVKEVKPEQYASVAAAFDAAIVEYKQKQAA